MSDFEQRLKKALELDIPYAGRNTSRSREAEGTATRAAVLLILAKNEDQGDSEFSTLFLKRTEHVENHKGQMAFPGGVIEPGEDVIQAALRETEEEVGLPRQWVRVLGTLPNLITTTGFLVTPVVGMLTTELKSIELKLNDQETEEVYWFRLADLTSPGIYRREQLRIGAVKYPIHVYQIEDCRIWGATAAMTKNLLDRLESLG